MADASWITIMRPGPFGESGIVLTEEALKEMVTNFTGFLPVEPRPGYALEPGAGLHGVLGHATALRYHDGALQAKVAWAAMSSGTTLALSVVEMDCRDPSTGANRGHRASALSPDSAWSDGVYVGGCIPADRGTT